MIIIIGPVVGIVWYWIIIGYGVKVTYMCGKKSWNWNMVLEELLLVSLSSSEIKAVKEGSGEKPLSSGFFKSSLE